MKDDEVKPSGSIFAGRFVILNLLGSGGMGAVYLAKDRFIDESLVAVKILHRQYSTNHEFVQRFLREVKATRLVSHPNVVRSFDAAQFEGDFYYTMEFLKGTRLSELADEEDPENQIPWETAENILRQICFGLEAIHRANLVHRDLKPDNIFLEDDDVIKITDFGVVRMNNSSLTQSHAILGTLDYVPPEVWNGKAPCAQSDIYALGLVMYELLTGSLPFHASTPAELMKLHLTEIPIPIAEIRSDLPGWANHLIMTMLAKELQNRPESVTEVLRLIHSGKKGAKDSTSSSSSSHHVIPSSSRRTKRTEEISESFVKYATADSHPAIKHKRRASANDLVRAEAFTSATSLKKVTLDSGVRKNDQPLPPRPDAPAENDSDESTAQLPLKALSAPANSRTLLLAAALVSLLSLLAFPSLSRWISSAPPSTHNSH